MPRPRARPLFELGGQWISEEPGRAGLYRFWNDASTGRTRRASLGTADLGAAKIALAEIVIQGAPKTADSLLSVVLEKYFIEKTDFQRTKDMARHAGGMLLRQWGELVRISGITQERQKQFVKWAIEEQGYAISYVERILVVLSAALNHSKLTIDLVVTEGAILAKWPEISPKPPRAIYEPTDEELARLLGAAIPEDLRRWLLNAMATGGRPEAVLELVPAQRKQDLGLLDLNPAGRRQNKKYRPVVRELPTQGEWLDKWSASLRLVAVKNQPHQLRYCGYASVDSVDTALRRARVKEGVNIARLSVYSIRHRVASVLRAARDPRVPGEQISFQMGHRRPLPGAESVMTRRYGELPADYLAEAATVLEAWVTRVLRMSKVHAAERKVA